MFRQTYLIRLFSLVLLSTSLMLFLGGCSQNSNPLESNIESEATGISELNIIQLPQSDGMLQKLIVEGEYIRVYQGGELELESGQDFELIELIKKAPYQISTYDLGQVLLNASPLSANVLKTICENTNLRNDYWMITVLLQNAPLRECVLNTLIDKGFINHSYYMKEILVASSPLPQSVLYKLYWINLTSSDRQLVLNAQVGVRQDEFTYNSAGGGLEINLEILPYSLSRDAYISMATDDNYLLGDVYVTFGPHGTLFNPPAVLNFKVSGVNLSGVNPDLIDIYYVNPSTGLWELMPRENVIVDAGAGYINIVNAQFSHFSRYAIGMR